MRRNVIGSIVLGVIFSAFALAQSQAHNDPLAIITNKPRPNVLILFDTSASMLWDTRLVSGNEITVRKENQDGTVNVLLNSVYNIEFDTLNSFLVDSDNPRSRMGQAKAAMREMISQIQDINIGLGRFSRELKLHRFRASLPATINQTANLDSQYTYTFYDGQSPVAGQINIPMYRVHNGTLAMEYLNCRTVRNDAGIYWSWDATDVTWSTNSANTQSISGEHHTRMNWSYSEVEDSRRQMFRALTSSGDYIYRDTYAATDSTHRNKLNQIDNVDIFLSDTQMLQLKANTDAENVLTYDQYIDSVYDVPVEQTLTFTYYPVVADWDNNVSCNGGEILVDIQNRFDDNPDTLLIDESDNRADLIALTRPINTNAKVYDFSVDPAELTLKGPLYGIGATPLAATLDSARSYFENTIFPRDTTNGVIDCRDNFIVLFTDGIENCGGNPEAIAQDIYENFGIKVYVIAFASDTSQADGIASAGGTEQAFTADDKDQLVEVLNSILGEIKTAVELSAPVAATSTETAGDYIEGDIALLPFFDVPRYQGHLHARKIFKLAVIQIDTKTGAVITDTGGNPIIIEDDISEARVVALKTDPTNPIDKDPSREIVGIQLTPPTFLWDAGELLSMEVIDNPYSQYVYPYLQADATDLDGDGDTSELIVNPAYQKADDRRILTTLDPASTNPAVVDFDTTTLIDTSANHDTAKALMGVAAWSDDEARFLINYTRGKVIQRFTETTSLYGNTYNPGDPMPDPASADGDGDGVPDEFLYEERGWKMGDMVGVSPVVVRAPTGEFPIAINDNNNLDGDGQPVDDYDEFAAANSDIPPIVIVGANDGMIHAFTLNGIDANSDNDFNDAGDYYPGEEVWAFVLPDTMNKLQNLFADSASDDDYEPDGQRRDPHQYFADGQISVSVVRARVHIGDTDGDGNSTDPEFRIMMFFGEGRGGSTYWAFDVTDPMNPAPVWSLTDATMGMSISRPAVGPISAAASPDLDNDTFKYYAFMGSGFDYSQTDGSAAVGNVFYKVDVKDGTIVETFSAGDVAGGADIPNAIVSRGIVVDVDNDYLVERAYFADLDGNIWRWNLDTGLKTNILAVPSNELTTEEFRLERPILDSITHANVFGFNIITAATGGDTRAYLDPVTLNRKDFPQQTIYLLVDTDQQGKVRSLLDGIINSSGEYEDSGTTTGVDLPSYMIAENQPVVSAFTDYNEEGNIYRGFQSFYPTFTPDASGLRSVRCSFGDSDLVVLDSIFSESSIVETTTASVIEMGEGKATGITYTGGNILFAVGDQFKVMGSGIYRFESSQEIKARLKLLEWKEIY